MLVSAKSVEAFFVFCLKLTERLMGVNTTISAIFAIVSIFTGNILSEDRGPILLKHGDLTLQFFEKVRLGKSEVLAHRKREECNAEQE